MGVMRMLSAATTRQDFIENLQDYIEGEPDILDWCRERRRCLSSALCLGGLGSMVRSMETPGQSVYNGTIRYAGSVAGGGRARSIDGIYHPACRLPHHGTYTTPSPRPTYSKPD